MKTTSVRPSPNLAQSTLARATRIFVDTAPVIYFVEQHPRYLPLVEPVFDRIAGIRDVVGFQGETVNELRAAFEEAVDANLETCENLGRAPQ